MQVYHDKIDRSFYDPTNKSHIKYFRMDFYSTLFFSEDVPMRKPYLLLPCLFFIAFTCSTALSGEQPVTSRHLPTQQVKHALVEELEVPALIELVGTLQAVERAAIAAKVTGVITEIPVRLGSSVLAGDLLVRISAEEISAKLNQAKAQLTQARRNLDREEKLLARKASTTETVKSMRELYAVAKAGHDEAKTMLGYTVITAPFDGVITQKKAHGGDLATPGSHLLLLENNSRLQVVTAVPESLIHDITTGDSLTVSIPSAGLLTTGTVAEIAPSADPSSRTAPVKINLEIAPGLRSGQFARIALPGKDRQSLFIPVSAVLTLGQMDTVFVNDNDTAHLRLIRTGMHHDGRVEILSGLVAGEWVVTDNNHLLVNGQPLQVIK